MFQRLSLSLIATLAGLLVATGCQPNTDPMASAPAQALSPARVTNGVGANGYVWTNVSSKYTYAAAGGTAPQLRSNYQMVDLGNTTSLLFGGADNSNAPIPVAQGTWLWDSVAQTWKNVSGTVAASPSARQNSYLAVVAPGQAILFGGEGAGTGNFLGDTWLWTSGSGWSQLTVTGAPSVRSNGMMASLGDGHSVLLFGGRNGSGALSGTFIFDLATRKWTVQSSTTTPPGRWAAGMKPVGKSGKVLLYGGWGADTTSSTRCTSGNQVGNGPLGDTYMWQSGSWTKLTPAHKPTVKAHPAMTAMGNGDLVIFGGSVDCDWTNKDSNDIWQWDDGNSDWRKITLYSPTAAPLNDSSKYTQGGAPVTRYYMNAAPVDGTSPLPGAGGLMIFGGANGGNLVGAADATWVLTPVYNVTATAATSDGTASCSPNYVPWGGSSTCTFTPNGANSLSSLDCNYNCDSYNGIKDCASLTCPSATGVINNIQGDLVVTAHFGPVGSKAIDIVNPPGASSITCTPNPVLATDTTSTCTVNCDPNAVSLTALSCIGQMDASSCPALTPPSCGSSFTVTGINGDIKLIPVFQAKTFAVTGFGAIGGSASCSPSPVNYASSSTCAITPDSTYILVGLTCQDHDSGDSIDCGVAPGMLGTLTSFSFASVTHNIDVIPSFSAQLPILTVTPTGGHVSCPAGVNAGGTATCTIVPDDGYELASLTCFGTTGTDCSAVPLTATTFDLTTVQTAINVAPIFVKANKVIVNNVLGGTITCTPAKVPDAGVSGCTVAPLTGYTLTGLSCLNKDGTNFACPTTGLASLSTFTLTGIDQDVTITPAYTAQAFKVTDVPAVSGNSLLCNKTSGITSADTVTCTLVLAPGYEVTPGSFECVGTVSGCALPAAPGDMALTTFNSDVVLQASFRLKKFPIVVPAGIEGGTVVCSPNPVSYGQDAQCVVNPATGYQLDGATCGNNDCPAVPQGATSFTIPAVKEPTTVTPSFSVKPLTVTVNNPAAGGTMTCTPSSVLPAGKATCTVTPDAANGFEFKGLACVGYTCPPVDTTTTSLTLDPINANVTLAPVFGPAANLAISTNSVNGSIVCKDGANAVVTSVAPNSGVSCTATPNTGFALVNFSCQGTATSGCLPSSTASAATLAGITSDIALTATFVKVQNPITYTGSDSNGRVDCTSNPADYGAAVVCTLTPNTGYVIAGLGCTPSTACPTPTPGMDSFVIPNVTEPINIASTFAPQQFSVTTHVAPYGTITCVPSTVGYGGSSQCTFQPDAGYQLGGLACTGITCPSVDSLTSSSFTLPNITSDVVVTPLFTSVASYSIATSGQNGSISCTPNPVLAGGSVNCTVFPSTGYLFSSLACSGTMDSDCPSAGASVTTFSLAGINSNLQLTGVFTQITYPITVLPDPSNNGLVTCVPAQVPYSANSVCTVRANPGYELKSATCPTGAACSATQGAANFTISDVMAATTVQPVFGKKMVHVTVVEPGTGGSMTCTPDVAFGGTSRCQFTAEPNYTLAGLSCIGTNCPSATGLLSPFDLANLQNDVTIAPIFTMLGSYAVATNASNGTISCDQTSVITGGAVTCSVTPNAGYVLASFGCTGSAASNCPNTNLTSPASVTGVTSDLLFTATFTKIQNPITYTPVDPNGVIDCEPNPVDYAGGSICTISPATGYELSTLTCSSGICPAVAPGMTSFVVNDLTGPLDLAAVFKPKSLTITVIPGSNGQMNCPATAHYGDLPQCTFSASNGYTLRGLACGGIACPDVSGLASPFDLGTMTQNVVLSPIFAPPDKFTVATNAPNGTIACTPDPVVAGQPTTCTVTAAPGYSFSNLNCNGYTPCPAVDATTTSFTLPSVTGDVSLDGLFTKQTFPITYNNPSDGTVTCVPETVGYGDYSICTLHPAAGAAFSSVSCTGTACVGVPAKASTFVIPNIRAATVVSPVFSAVTHTVTVVYPASNPSANDTVVCAPSPVADGQSVICTVTSNPTDTLRGLVCTGTTCPTITTPPPTTFTLDNITADVMLSPIFTPPGFWAISANSVNGVITCESVVVVDQGSVKCSATPNPGYAVTSFGCSGSATGCTASLAPDVEFTDVASNLSLNAVFAKVSNAITVTPKDSNGTVTCSPNPADYGASSLCTITPVDGFTIGTLDCTPAVCPVVTPGMTSFTLSGVTAPITVAPGFVQKPYYVVVTPMPNGQMTCTPSQVLPTDPVPTCTFTADPGYVLKGLTCSGTTCPTGSLGTNTGSFSLGTLTGDATVTPVFATPDMYTVVATANNGTIVCLPSAVVAGMGVTCTVTPQIGYVFSQLACVSGTMTSSCPQVTETTTSFALDGITSNIVLNGTFVAKTYNITTPTVPNGTIICAPTAVPAGGSSMCVFSPAAGYKPTAVTCNSGPCAGADVTQPYFTLSSVTSDTTVTPTYGIAGCNTDADCTGGYCDLTLVPHTCYPKKPAGQGPCASNNQCQSARCDTTATPTVCLCADGKAADANGNCTAASGCGSDTDCPNGYCDKSATPAVCQPKKPAGQGPCSTNNQCLSNLCDTTTQKCVCPAGQHDDGTGNCTPIVPCATGMHDAGNGQCIANGTCGAGFVYDSSTKLCEPQLPCATGEKNDGAGHCVATNAACAQGYHDGGDALCVANGTCSVGFKLDVDGVTCIPVYACSAAFHYDGVSQCVPNVSCAAGYQDNGAGLCVAIPTSGPPTCVTGTHDGGSGQCVPNALCQERYHALASGACVADVDCGSSQHNDGLGHCVNLDVCADGFHDGGSDDCISGKATVNECNVDLDCAVGSQCVEHVCKAIAGRLQGDGGCSTGGSGSLWAGLVAAMMALVLLARSKRMGRVAAGTMAAVLLGAGTGSIAHAQATTKANFELQRFQPSLGLNDILGVESAQTGKHLEWALQAFGNYASKPLELIPSTGGRMILVKDQGAVDVGLALALFDHVELAVALPISATFGLADQGRSITDRVSDISKSATVEGLRITPKINFLNLGSFHFGVSAPIGVPFSKGSFMQGTNTYVNPRFLAEYAGPFQLSANVGALFRNKENFIDKLTTGNTITYGLGASLPLVHAAHSLDLLATAQGEGGWEQSKKSAIPLEGLAALKWTLPSDVAFTLGGGAGLIRGYGAPEYRVLGGIAFAPKAHALPQAPPKVLPRTEPLSTRVQAPNSLAIPVMKQVRDADPKTLQLVGTNGKNGALQVMPDGTVRYTPKNGFSGRDSFTYLLKTPEGQLVEGLVDVQVDPAPKAPEPKPVPNEQVKIVGKELVILDQVYFATGKDVILTKSYPLLDNVASVLHDHPELKKVQVEGHTDNQGKPAKNLDLSERRAAMVAKYLVEHGVEGSRLTSAGYGQTRPIADNKTSTGRARNRRVAFKILDQASQGQP